MRPAVYGVGAVTGAFGLLFGFSTAVIAGVLGGIAESFHLTTGQAELTVALLVASCFVSAVVAGPVSARIGRRRTLGIATGLAGCGYAIVILNGDLSMLLVARVLIGLAVGLSSMVAPMYAGEASPVRLRGAVVSVFQLAITLGMLSAYAAPLVLGDGDWQTVIGSGLLVTALCLVTLLMVPESPYWLMIRGRHAEAAANAAFLGIDVPHPAPEAAAASPNKLLAGSTLAVLVLCSSLFILQNLSGIDGVLYYAPRIFTQLGLTAGTAALMATLGLGIVNVLATIMALIYVDRLGRRLLLNVGCTVMVFGLALAILADTLSAPLIGLIGLAVFIAAFAISLGPLPYVLMSELFPSAVREKGIAIASATSWLFNALVAANFLSGIEMIGLSGVLLVFALVCMIALLIALRFVPETRGVSLEAIEAKVVGGTRLRWVGLEKNGSPAVATVAAETTKS
ncbi:MAG: sugar porter family MFS transporter [Pseudomonadota bacterium]